MRKAICPQPVKRVFFKQNKFEITNKVKSLIKLFYFSAVILLVTGMSTNAIGEPLSSGFPALNVSTNGNTTEYSFPLQILLLMTG